jgi:HEAT repeat protein
LDIEGICGEGGLMSKVEEYRDALRKLDDWDSFLLAESGLPGPRGNIELGRAVAEEGGGELFRRYLAYDEEMAPTNSPQEFLVFCGVLGLGRLLAEGNREVLPTLRECASDKRWRTREAVAMALQRWGEADMGSLLREMEEWSKGSVLEKRAAAAALCEPRLLGDPSRAREVLRLLDSMTASIEFLQDRKSDEFVAFRKGLGYCWSVAVAALPEEGKPLMEKWFSSDDKDVLWIMKENLKKKRLERTDSEWVRKWQGRLGMR